ncbi:MAG: gamma-glutamyltransferase, partial [Hyphomicrobiaceae bacterium]
NYLAQRAKLIDPRRAMTRPTAGLPPGAIAAVFGRDATQESSGTTHISIVDTDGNAVSMTSTIESAFGSGLWASGFLLNNELTDFSFRPTDEDDRPTANRIEPSKRPRSSMAPTVIFDPEGNLLSVLGSPGGSRIILYVLKAIVGLIDWKLDAQAVASIRNFGSRGRDLSVEYGEALTTDIFSVLMRAPSVWHGLQLRAFGHRIRPTLMTSGLHIVHRNGKHFEGGADPRREGVALGD